MMFVMLHPRKSYYGVRYQMAPCWHMLIFLSASKDYRIFIQPWEPLWGWRMNVCNVFSGLGDGIGYSSFPRNIYCECLFILF